MFYNIFGIIIGFLICCIIDLRDKYKKLEDKIDHLINKFSIDNDFTGE